MLVGNVVRIVVCEECPNVVNKTVEVTEVLEGGRVRVNYGRGRPQANRPSILNVSNLEVVEE